MDALLQNAITVVLFVLILGSLVLVHEIGHFVTARLAGVRVLEFGVGFPPRARVIRSSGETLYTLNWLPIGGFVKLEGEDGDDTRDPRSFANARLSTKLGILVAGVVMNLATALAIFFLVAWLATPIVGIKVPVVDPGSPGAIAGLTDGDAIVAVDGRRHDLFSLQDGDVIDDLRARPGQTVTIAVDRPNVGRLDLRVTLRTQAEIDKGLGPLGIRVANTTTGWEPYFPGEYVGHHPVDALRIAASETIRWFGLILDGLGRVVSGFVTNPTAPPAGVSGPIGIAASIGEIFWGYGPIMTFYVAGILSANLALVNALPFPPLDGGRMLLILLKQALGKRISLSAERLTYFVGFAFLMAFLIWVTIFDVLRGTAAS
jgi:regulator of sigma E protease